MLKKSRSAEIISDLSHDQPFVFTVYSCSERGEVAEGVFLISDQTTQKDQEKVVHKSNHCISLTAVALATRNE